MRMGNDLSDELTDRFLTRLGIDGRVATDLAGLTRLYQGWSARMPYENGPIRLQLSAAPGRPVTGVSPAELFAANIRDGASSQCTDTAPALYALLCKLGFEATMAMAYFDHAALQPTMVNHVSVVVTLGGRQYVTDTVMLSGTPIELVPHEAVYDPLPYAVARDALGTWQIDSITPVGRSPRRVWLLAGTKDPAAADTVLEAVQVKGFDDFNAYYYGRLNRYGEVVTFSSAVTEPRLPSLHRTTRSGTVSQPCHLPEDRKRAMIEGIGLSPAYAAKLPPDRAPAVVG
jgi:hypothetical protein